MREFAEILSQPDMCLYGSQHVYRISSGCRSRPTPFMILLVIGMHKAVSQGYGCYPNSHSSTTTVRPLHARKCSYSTAVRRQRCDHYVLASVHQRHRCDHFYYVLASVHLPARRQHCNHYDPVALAATVAASDSTGGGSETVDGRGAAVWVHLRRQRRRRQ